MREINRRNVLKVSGVTLGTGLSAGLAGCLGDDDDDDDDDPGDDDDGDDAPADDDDDGDDDEVEADPFDDLIIDLEGSFSAITMFLAQEAGIWNDHSINASVEIADFGRFGRSFSAELTPINYNAIPPLASNIADGIDLYFVDRYQHMINRMFVPEDSEIEEIPDLADAVLGVPFAGSATTTSFRAMHIDINDFDILEDTQDTIAAPPPALMSLIDEGEIDAMAQFSAQTIEAIGRDDLRTLWDPVVGWEAETGHPPTTSIVAARQEWVDEYPERALRWLDAYDASIEYHQDNSDEALQRYGRLLGLAEESGTLEVAAQLFDDELVYAEEWNEGYVDSQFRLMELMHDLDGIDTLPDRDEVVLYRSDIEEMI